jgi:hypothetical protein
MRVQVDEHQEEYVVPVFSLCSALAEEHRGRAFHRDTSDFPLPSAIISAIKHATSGETLFTLHSGLFDSSKLGADATGKEAFEVTRKSGGK